VRQLVRIERQRQPRALGQRHQPEPLPVELVARGCAQVGRLAAVVL